MKILYKISLIIVFTSFSTCLAGTFTIPDWVKNSCVFVMSNDTTAIGSGFLIAINHDNISFCYLVSAKHVIEPALKNTDSILIRVNRKGENFAQILKLPTLFFNGKKWIEHKNPAIDVAIVPLPIWDKISSVEVEMFTVRDSTKDYFADIEFIKKYKVNSGDDVFTLGLVPELYNKAEKNLVLSRFGTVSALPQYNLKLPGGEQKAYFLDCPAFGGNSGGPAYIKLERTETGDLIAGWRIALLGIVTEFIPSPLRIRQVETENTNNIGIQLIENTGISKVVPVDYLKDLLYSNEQVEFRSAIIKKNSK